MPGKLVLRMTITLVRTLILYLSIMIAMRIMGKRQLGELEPSELVVAVMISDLASNPLQDTGTPLLYGLIPVITLLCCEMLVSGAVLRSLRLRAFICGKPSIIIRDGRIDQREMKKNRFTIDELIVELRRGGILDIAAVRYAVLETNGTLSILPAAAGQPPTARDLGVQAQEAEYPVILINDGRILRENLPLAGAGESWLRGELKRRRIRSAADVYLLTRDGAGRVYCAQKETER